MPDDNTLNYSSNDRPSFMAICKSLSLLILAGLCVLCAIIADFWERLLDGRHNPKLWFFMPPSEHWKGTLGIALRDFSGCMLLLGLVLAGIELLFLIYKSARRTSRRLVAIEWGLWGAVILIILAYAAVPRIDL